MGKNYIIIYISMAAGKIITQSLKSNTGNTTGVFKINFNNASFGPYSHIFHRKNLYFNEETGERGSHFFPLKTTDFKNTEIFLETNNIAVSVGTRGSFSGQEKLFVEVVNLKTQNKHRFYPEEVSLIYNSKTSINIYYKKSGKYKKLELDIKTLEKISETSVHLDAFFKLLYNFTEENFMSLHYTANSKSHMAGYFTEKYLKHDSSGAHERKYTPISFNTQDFSLKTKVSPNASIVFFDVWEASLTGKL